MRVFPCLPDFAIPVAVATVETCLAHAALHCAHSREHPPAGTERAKLLAGWTGAHERTVKNFRTIRALRPTPRSIGSAFRPGAKCHFVDGGSAGSAFRWKGRGSEAKGVGVGKPTEGTMCGKACTALPEALSP